LESEVKHITTEDDSDIFKYGITFVIDGIAPEYIENILTQLIIQESDHNTRTLKWIQKEAVFAIQQGSNSRVMLAILNSYTDISLAENKEIINLMDKEVQNDTRQGN